MQTLPENLYQTAQIRELEARAGTLADISTAELMQRAGQAVFTEVQQRWPQQRRLAVFCGAGNNAGDGYVAARLALQAGFQVSVHAVSPVTALQGLALNAYQAYQQANGQLAEPDAPLAEDTLIIDALLGTGLNRPLTQAYADAILQINSAACPVLAVDIPSGLHADTGQIMGSAVQASVTLSFIALKPGLFTGQAADCCGDIVCADLGVPSAAFTDVLVAAKLLKKAGFSPRRPSAHKGQFGHVLLIGGNHGYSGAIRLAAEAALRSGAGLVSLATRASHADLIPLTRPEIMSHGVETIAELSVLLNKASVIGIGPGLAQDDWALAMFNLAINVGKPLVVDADALNILAKHPQQRDNWILTPHPGEAARLLNTTTAAIGAERYQAVTSLQQRYGGVCVLKGAGSLIRDAEQTSVGTTGNPGMAGGGMGDVLTGICTAFLAQGLSISKAAQQAVYIHGQAADISAAKYGQRGMLASDLFAELRTCVNTGD